jgi:hypothetical protein
LEKFLRRESLCMRERRKESWPSQFFLSLFFFGHLFRTRTPSHFSNLPSPPCRPFRKKNTREGPSKWNCWQRFLLARLMRNFWRKLFSL